MIRRHSQAVAAATFALFLALLGCGGIMLPEHFDAFFEAGADVAMSATGLMWDPYLAMRYHARALAHP
jgi:dihydroorotate dehydrogenase